MNDATLYRGSKYAWIRMRGAWYRYRCGRRFGHFPIHGQHLCARCDATLI